MVVNTEAQINYQKHANYVTFSGQIPLSLKIRRNLVWWKEQYKWSTKQTIKKWSLKFQIKRPKSLEARSYSTQNLKFLKEMCNMLIFPEKYVKTKENSTKLFFWRNRNINVPLLHEVEAKAADAKISRHWTSRQLTQHTI